MREFAGGEGCGIFPSHRERGSAGRVETSGSTQVGVGRLIRGIPTVSQKKGLAGRCEASLMSSVIRS
ncbi:hypothetical protein FHT70_003506 [Rhizobium sp. BK049]|nr:hypothetical protein [Rhizobium sp. BK049]